MEALQRAGNGSLAASRQRKPCGKQATEALQLAGNGSLTSDVDNGSLTSDVDNGVSCVSSGL